MMKLMIASPFIASVMMNLEESRLKTFSNWPVNAPVDPKRIAKAGFYYTGQNLEVQCFSCSRRISEWNYNDTVMTLHRELDPVCPFVLSPVHSGNVPITVYNGIQRVLIPDETISVNRISNVDNTSDNDMCDEILRLNTFQNWPISYIVTPESLAKAGLYYIQQDDNVKCPYCSMVIGHWEIGDVPLEEHRHHSPACSYVQSASVTDSTSYSGVTFRERACSHLDSSMRSLGVQSHCVAKHIKYNSRDSRLATYTMWPGDVVQTPSDLADAGFYYVGSGDQVRCFHCDGGLRQWDPSDSPWVEHARWFPRCGFVKRIKGDEFINKCISEHPPILPGVASGNGPSPGTAPRQHISGEELERLMNSPIIIAALQIGLELSKVKMAVRHQLEETGLPFATADDLIEATLDLNLDEIPSQEPEETWGTPLQSPLRQRSEGSRSVHVRFPSRGSSQESSDSSESDTTHPTTSNLKKVKCDETEKKKPVSVTDSSQNVALGRTVTLEEENRRLRESRMCKICMDSEVSVVFLPCGHLLTCFNCAHSLANCPLCRRTINATVRTFLS